jgi:hypothetical protein
MAAGRRRHRVEGSEQMPMWTVVIGPDEREHTVRADALEVSGGALVFTTSGIVTWAYAPSGYDWVRLEEE